MKHEARHLRTSKLFEYAIKSYIRDLACCGMSWNNVQHKVQCDIEDTKTLSPSIHCFCNTMHISLLAWPFFYGGIFLGKSLSRSHGTFLSMEWWPYTFFSISLPCSVSRICTRCTLSTFHYLFLVSYSWQFWNLCHLFFFLSLHFSMYIRLEFWALSCPFFSLLSLMVFGSSFLCTCRVPHIRCWRTVAFELVPVSYKNCPSTTGGPFSAMTPQATTQFLHFVLPEMNAVWNTVSLLV